jgi:hypothetical protein
MMKPISTGQSIAGRLGAAGGVGGADFFFTVSFCPSGNRTTSTP